MPGHDVTVTGVLLDHLIHKVHIMETNVNGYSLKQ